MDIGKLIHKKQPLENLTIMSEQVIKTILSELGLIADKHKLIIFDLDRTLIKDSSIEVIAKELHFEKELINSRKKYREKKIKDYDITLTLAKCLKGKTRSDIERACEKLSLSENAVKVIEKLRRRQYKIAIISLAFSPVVEYIAEKVGIDKENIICPVLVTDKKGKYTGEVIARTRFNSKCCDKIICKADAAGEFMDKFTVKPEECIAVGDGKSDECMFRACGLSLAYNSKLPIGNVKITNLAEILVYVE